MYANVQLDSKQFGAYLSQSGYVSTLVIKVIKFFAYKIKSSVKSFADSQTYLLYTHPHKPSHTNTSHINAHARLN